MMIAIGIAFMLATLFMLAWAFYIEATGERDALYSNPMTLARINASAYINARRDLRKARDWNMRQGLTLRGLAKVQRKLATLNECSVTFGATLTKARAVYSLDNSEPQFATIARVHAVARTFGIRLRPVSQDLRKGYVRILNRAGLNFETVKMIDSLLMS